jgi:hypothetical protein
VTGTAAWDRLRHEREERGGKEIREEGKRPHFSLS